MGNFMKKLSRALSIEPKSRKSSKNKVEQNSNYLNAERLTAAERLSAAANDNEQRGSERYSERFPEQQRLELDHVRSDVPHRDEPVYAPQSAFAAQDGQNANIQEFQSARRSSELAQNGNVFVRPEQPDLQPRVSKTFTRETDSNQNSAAGPSTPERKAPSLIDTPVSQGTARSSPALSSPDKPKLSSTKPTVALTVLIDTSLSANQAHIKHISLGILKLLLALSPDDTISIFGYDGQGKHGLFTFEAQKEHYADIMKLVCDLHSRTPRESAPKLFDAIVMVVEELSNLNPDDLKPFIIMADYQDPEQTGQPFEAQHALLWGSAQNLRPIFVSVWDSEIFNEIKPSKSKQVHIDTLSSAEISAATLVLQSHLKDLMQEHKKQIAARDPPPPAPAATSPPAGSNIAGPSSSPYAGEQTQPHRDLSQIPTLPDGLPPIYERPISDSWAESSAHPSMQRTSVASIASEVDPRASDLDSLVNVGTSSAGTVDRETLNVADFGEEFMKEGKEASSGQNLTNSNDFRGFPNATESLFLESEGSERSLADIVRHRRNQSKASSTGVSSSVNVNF